MAMVNEIMTKDVVTIDNSSSIFDASIVMSERDVGCLIVTNDGNAEGIITEGDIVRRGICKENDPKKTNVSSIMSSPLITVNPLMSVEDVAEILNHAHIKRLGVVSAHELVGIITITDIVAAETKLVKVLERYVRIVSGK